MNANEHQVGGQHYRTEGGVQHWDIVYTVFGGDYLIGNATKYLARIGKKGGVVKSIEDIDKAIHYLTKKREHLQAQLQEEAARTQAAHVNQGVYRGDLRFKDTTEL